MKIAIIDDHTMVAESVQKALSTYPGVKEIRLFSSGDIFIEKNDGWVPHLIISDILMPGNNGVELIKSYKTKGDENLKIIILSSISNVQTVKRAMKYGVNGYLSKEESLDELLIATKEVMEGKHYVSKILRSDFISNLLNDDAKTIYRLSPREKDVLYLICSGKIIKEMAIELGISITTAQSYQRNILQKFKVKRNADIILFAIRNGLYIPEERNEI